MRVALELQQAGHRLGGGSLQQMKRFQRAIQVNINADTPHH
jgi:hypothetical protein